MLPEWITCWINNSLRSEIPTYCTLTRNDGDTEPRVRFQGGISAFVRDTYLTPRVSDLRP